MKELRIITNESTTYSADNIHGAEDLFANTSNIFALNEIKKEVTVAINNIVDMIDLGELHEKGFDLSEMSFNLNINAEGKVSLLSCVSGGVSAQSGITIKIIRRSE